MTNCLRTVDKPASDMGESGMATSEELRAKAAAARQDAERIGDSASVPDRAGAMLAAGTLRRQNERMDSALRKSVEATRTAQHLEHQAALAEAREQEASRQRLTHADLIGATHVKDQHGQWREVVRLSAKSVTVTTGYSWTDRITIDKIRAAFTVPAEATA